MKRVAVLVSVSAVLLASLQGGAGAGTGRLADVVTETPRSGFRSSGARVVALTFDDGPHPVWTPKILRILREKQAPAAFFMVGREAKRYPELVRKVAARGHGIGGHTWSHRDLRWLSAAAFSDQVDTTTRLLTRLPDPNRTIRCVRPPFGAYDARVISRLGARGLTTVTWSMDPRDWTRPGAKAIVSRAMAELKPGGIVVLHDGGGDRSQTVAALPALISRIRKAGYRVVPICHR